MSRRKVIADIKEILEDSGYVWEPDDLPGSIARAIDEAWRNGYCVGYDERAPNMTEVHRLISEVDAVAQKLSSVVADLSHASSDDLVGYP